MKKIIACLILVSAVNVMASEQKTRLLLKDSKVLSVELNDETVRCSAFGYGQSELKVNIKGLDGWTLLDHSNIRFGDANPLPCMTAGVCGQEDNDLSVEKILHGNPRTEKVTVNREVSEVKFVTTGTAAGPKACQRQLVETLETVVGGVPFKHSRSIMAELLPLASCTL